MTWTKRNNFERPEIAFLEMTADIDGWGEVHKGGNERILAHLREFAAAVRGEWQKMLVAFCEGDMEKVERIRGGVDMKMRTVLDGPPIHPLDISPDHPELLPMHEVNCICGYCNLKVPLEYAKQNNWQNIQVRKKIVIDSHVGICDDPSCKIDASFDLDS